VDRPAHPAPIEVLKATMIVKLLVVHGRPIGKVLLFGPGDYFLGRGPECHIRFNSDWVSRQHCLLRIEDDQAQLRDLGSRNGTLVNGRLLDGEHPLVGGDLLQVGPVVFKVDFQPGEPRTAPPMPESPPTLEPQDGAGSTQGPTLGTTAQHPPVPGLEPET
jgi:pSer/pThr/pTyr-binding forkhead associated (FHA) protein